MHTRIEDLELNGFEELSKLLRRRNVSNTNVEDTQSHQVQTKTYLEDDYEL